MSVASCCNWKFSEDHILNRKMISKPSKCERSRVIIKNWYSECLVHITMKVNLSIVSITPIKVSSSMSTET